MGSGFLSFLFNISESENMDCSWCFLKIRIKEPPISGYFKTLREMMVLTQEPKVL